MSDLREQLVEGYRRKVADLRAQGKESEAQAWADLLRMYKHASGANK